MTITVTPGYTFQAGETVTEEKLNQLGSPTASIAGESGAPAQPNLFSNPDLSIWTRGSGPVSCPLDTATYLADQWFVRPRKITGGTYDEFVATYQKESDTVYGTQLYRARAGFSSKTGTITAEIEFGQRRLARITTKLADKFVVACELENQTGTAYQPKARIYTCASADSYGSVNAQETVLGTAATGSNTLGNGERRLFYFVFTASSYDAALKMGGEICIVIPETAAGAGYTRIYGPLKVETGETPTTREPERDPSGEQTTSAGASTAPFVDYLQNGGFELSRFPALGTAVNVTTTETQVADGWLAQTAAGTATSQYDGTVPDGKSTSALKFTGAVGVDVLTLRQRIYADASGTAKRPLVFSAWIRNGTGASLTPTLRILSCDGINDFSSTTVQYSTTLSAIADGDYTRVSYLFDMSAITLISGGMVVELTFPAGSMNAGTKTIRVAQASLLPGIALADWQAIPAHGVSPLTEARNLKIVRDTISPTNALITADAVVLTARDGTARVYKNISCPVNLASGGPGGLDTSSAAADTNYYLYLCANDQDVFGVFSLSATAPGGMEAAPFQARISNFKTWDATSGAGQEDWIPFELQLGKSLFYAGPAGTFLKAAYTPSTTGITAVAIGGLPATAVGAGGYAGVTTASSTDAAMTISGTETMAGFVRMNIPGGPTWGDIHGGAPFRVPLDQTANLYLAATTTGSPSFTTVITQVEIA